MKNVFKKIFPSLIGLILVLYPTWLYFFAKKQISPKGFLQNIAFLYVGGQTLIGPQIFFLALYIMLLREIWKKEN